MALKANAGGGGAGISAECLGESGEEQGSLGLHLVLTWSSPGP